MRVKNDEKKIGIIKAGFFVLLLVAVAIPTTNLIRTSGDQEGTVLFISDESVYLDGMTEPVDYAAAIQKPGESVTQIVALTKKQYKSLEKGDTVTFYTDEDGIARLRTIIKGDA